MEEASRMGPEADMRSVISGANLINKTLLGRFSEAPLAGKGMRVHMLSLGVLQKSKYERTRGFCTRKCNGVS